VTRDDHVKVHFRATLTIARSLEVEGQDGECYLRAVRGLYVCCVLASSSLACSSTPTQPTDGGCSFDAGGAPDSQQCSIDTVDARRPPGPDCGAVTATTPSLSKLSVTSKTHPSVTLIPGFAPGIHDYYVLCDGHEGLPISNQLTVSVEQPEGTSSSIAVETPGGALGTASTQQTVSLSVQNDDAIVVSAVNGKSSQPYWVRCLPDDFPVMQWAAHADGCSRTPGYYLLGSEALRPPAVASYAMVLDTNGVPVWYYPEVGTGVFDVDSLATGTISFISGAMTLPWEIHQLSPSAVSGVGPAGPELDNHELRLLPNGHYLMFKIPIETGFNLSDLTIPGTGSSLGTDQAIASCEILEVDPTTSPQSVVWSWDVSDHFDPDTASTYPQPGAASWHAPDGGPAWDVFHCNSIDVDPKTGNLLVSARDMDSVFYVDYQTKKVLWKMGGTTPSKDDASFVPFADSSSGPFRRQHDARLLPGWSFTDCGGHGQISMFDDETNEPGVPARAVVYYVEVGVGTGCPSPSARVAWSYAGAVNSLYMGSFRVSSDGSRTIGWGVRTTSSLIFTEVDEAGHDLLDVSFLPGGSSYRAIKVPVEQLDLDRLRSSAALRLSGW
jgi:hypothetical protein